ncbi:phosphoglucomutase, partial [Staphylococcus gallinarum]
FKDRTLAPSFEGTEGVEKINRIMNYFRSNELSTLCGLEVKKVEDYESGYLTDKVKGTTESLTLPKANLIRFVFDEGFIALRPSGTEPKMKIYFSLNVEDIDKISTEFVNQYIDSIK